MSLASFLLLALVDNIMETKIKKLKRNSVVMETETAFYRFYGRVWKVLDENRVVVIDCGLHVTVYDEKELDLCSYRGKHRGKHFDGMPNLRNLMMSARRYNPKLEYNRNAT